jgi:hypothetical protein
MKSALNEQIGLESSLDKTSCTVPYVAKETGIMMFSTEYNSNYIFW